MDALQKRYEDQINELVESARRLGDLGYVTSHGGNLSYKVDAETVLITPTKVVKRKMTFADIVIVGGTGEVRYAGAGRKPTGETPMHLHLYRLRPDLTGLVHAHPPVLTGFSMVDCHLLEKPLLPEPVIEVGPVVSVPYAEPISDALARQFEASAHKSNAWLMQNHGVTIGSAEGVGRALDLLEMVEAMAMSVSVAMRLGKPMTEISREEVGNLENTMKTRNMPRPGDPRKIKSLQQLYFGG